MATSWFKHNDFEYGMAPDMPGYLIPEDGVYFARDMLFDQPGKARKRGGTWTPDKDLPVAGYLSNFQSGIEGIPDQIVSAWKLPSGGESGNNEAHFQLFNRANDPNLHNDWAINDVTITGLSDNSASMLIGRPFNHLGFQFVPIKATEAANNWFIVYGGTELDVGVAIVNDPYTSSGDDAVTMTLGSNNVTSASIMDWTTVCNRGDVVTITDETTYIYRGRVTSVDQTNLQVEPKPTVTGTYQTISFDHSVIPLDYYEVGLYGSDIACSYQYRIFIAHPKRWQDNMAPEIGQGDTSRTIMWTTLPTEVGVSNHTGLYIDGLVQSFRESILRNNFLTIPEMSPITAIAPMNGQLVVFSSHEIYSVTGIFETMDDSATDTNSIADRNVSKTVGCISKEGLQQHPRGTIFPANDGVYIYDGASLRTTMTGRMANIWRDLVTHEVIIHGSAIVRGNHYIISLESQDTQYTYMLNIDTGAWTTLSNVDVFSACDDPAFPGTTWGTLYTGEDGIFSGGNIVRLDTMFTPGDFTVDTLYGGLFDAVFNPSEKDPVTCELFSRGYTEGNPEARKWLLAAEVEYWLLSLVPEIVNVEVDTSLEPFRSRANDTYKLIGKLSNNFPNTVQGVTSVAGSPVNIFSQDHGYATGDQIIIEGLSDIPRLNGKWIITVIDVSNFTLNTSNGSAADAWTAGGVLRAPEARTFHTRGLIGTGYAVSYHIELTQETYEFEIIGLNHGLKALRQGRHT